MKSTKTIFIFISEEGFGHVVRICSIINEYYKNFNANVHRGAHQLSAKATEEFENNEIFSSMYA